MSNLKYKVGEKLINKATDSLYASFGDVIIESYVSGSSLKYYKVKCLGEESEDEFNEAELDFHFKRQEHVWENPSDFKKMTSSFSDMLEEKNKRYGNAALEPLSIVSKHHRLGAKIDEKLSRIKNAEKLKKNDLADVIGYCFLICKDMGWDNFDDQLD